jgi:hypothetical protein
MLGMKLAMATYVAAQAQPLLTAQAQAHHLLPAPGPQPALAVRHWLGHRAGLVDYCSRRQLGPTTEKRCWWVRLSKVHLRKQTAGRKQESLTVGPL